MGGCNKKLCESVRRRGRLEDTGSELRKLEVRLYVGMVLVAEFTEE
jgi:hypothetical protein